MKLTLLLLAFVAVLTSSRKAPGVACDPYAAVCPACVDCKGCQACAVHRDECSVCRNKPKKELPLPKP